MNSLLADVVPAPMLVAEATWGDGHKLRLELHAKLNINDPHPDTGGGFANTAAAVGGQALQYAYDQLKSQMDTQLAEMFKLKD